MTRFHRPGASALVALLLAGCVAAPVPTVSPPSLHPPSSSASASSAPSGPSVTASPSSPTTQVPTGRGSTLYVDPVDYEGSTVVRAGFAAGDRRQGRPVALQRLVDSSWQQIAVRNMSRTGEVEFLVRGSGGAYRAVALPGDDARAAVVATRSAKAADQWAPALNSGFTSSSVQKPWDYRLTDVYDAGGRWCSAPREANVASGRGSVTLTMSKAAKATTARVSASARRKQALADEKQVGCPEGVYGNAMISTQGRFTLTSGTVAARVKFPAEPGAHASVWLQSDARQEIDMIETFGYGRGITNVIHVQGKKVPADGKKAYVAADVVADPAWWDAWHTVSVEWDRSRIRFRLDGRLTRELVVATQPAQYFLVISLLSSDWETYRLSKPDARPGSGVKASAVPHPTLPFTMAVDWVRAWRRR